MKILVTGGAGFIGSHMAKMLSDYNHEVVVYDNLTTGFSDAVLNSRLIIGDLADTEKLSKLFSIEKFDSVFHFASSISVGESILKPGLYYKNNISCTLNLLNVMVEHSVKRLVFSSTAAVFGEPQYYPIDEKHPLNPINPYGKSKLFVEKILDDYDFSYGLRSVCLRYFNAAGADPTGQLGERHVPETHLIPLVLRVAAGKSEYINVFGNNYDTYDGTCIRDYIHVNDLCQAHILALQWLTNGNLSRKFNLGNGTGFSVLDIVESCRKITNKKININYSDRRPGDPAILIANSEVAKKELGWMPKYNDLNVIIRHAWQWENKNL